ncbi:hypothetical protein M9458_053748, partial [Cirrhinus mrigala]
MLNISVMNGGGRRKTLLCAQNWSNTTQLMLQEHHETLIKQMMQELRDSTDYTDWFLAFEIAANWAKNNFGKRIESDVFERAEALFTAEAYDKYDRRDNKKEPQSAIASTTQSKIQTQDPNINVPCVLRPACVSSNSDLAQGYGTTKRTVEYCLSDNKFPPLEPRPTIQPTTVQPLNPLPQIYTQMLVNTDEPQAKSVEPQPTEQGAASSVQEEELEQISAQIRQKLMVPYKHISTGGKQIDWSLNLKKKYVVIGDSVLSRIPAFIRISELQIDSFPGAKFQHAGNLVKKATIALESEILVLSFGINNRAQRCFMVTNKEIQRAYKMP